jgi:hypothetical protein
MGFALPGCQNPAKRQYLIKSARRCQEFCVTLFSYISILSSFPPEPPVTSHFGLQNRAERARSRQPLARRQRNLAREHGSAIPHSRRAVPVWNEDPCSRWWALSDPVFWFFVPASSTRAPAPAFAPATKSGSGSAPRASSARNSISSSDSAMPSRATAAPLPHWGTNPVS